MAKLKKSRGSGSSRKATSKVAIGRKTIVDKSHTSEYQRQLIANGIVNDDYDDEEQVALNQSHSSELDGDKDTATVKSAKTSTATNQADSVATTDSSTTEHEPNAPSYENLSAIESTEDSDEESAPDDSESSYDDHGEQVASNSSRPFSSKNMKRHRLTHSETRFLLNQFGQNPHPDAAQRALLSKQIKGLSARQIQVWFQNRRAKLKRMSAADADRMLSTRSYPDGYGPAGFYNPTETVQVSMSSRQADRHDAPYDQRSSIHMRSVGAAKSQFRAPETRYDDYNGQDRANPTFAHSYARSPLQPIHARYRAWEVAQASPISNYSDASGMRTPMQTPGLSSPYENIYASDNMSPAMPYSGRSTYRSLPPLYSTRPVPNEAEYVATLQANATAYGPPYDSKGTHYRSFLPPTQENSDRNYYSGLGQTQYYSAQAQESAYSSERYACRRSDYMRNSRTASYSYAEAHQSTIDEPMQELDEDGDTAPHMQREIKFAYDSADNSHKGPQQYSSVPKMYQHEQSQVEELRNAGVLSAQVNETDDQQVTEHTSSHSAEINGGLSPLDESSQSKEDYTSLRPEKARNDESRTSRVFDRNDREESPSFHQVSATKATGEVPVE